MLVRVRPLEKHEFSYTCSYKPTTRYYYVQTSEVKARIGQATRIPIFVYETHNTSATTYSQQKYVQLKKNNLSQDIIA